MLNAQKGVLSLAARIEKLIIKNDPADQHR